MGGVLQGDRGLRQRRHRHVDSRRGGVITTVFHRHHHIGGGGDYRTRSRILSDDEVVRIGDAVVGRLRPHDFNKVWNFELTLLLVNISRFRVNHIGCDGGSRQILYIIYICPILGCAVAGRVLVGVGHLAFASVYSLDFLTDKLDIRDGAVTTICHRREAGVYDRRVLRQVKCQRGSCRNTLHTSLSGSRNRPGAGVDANGIGIGSLTAIHTDILSRINVFTLAYIIVEIHRITACIRQRCTVLMGVSGDSVFHTCGVIQTYPHHRVVAETVLERDIEVNVVGGGACDDRIMIIHRQGDARVDLSGHRDAHSDLVAYADAVLGCHSVRDRHRSVGAVTEKNTVNGSLVVHSVKASTTFDVDACRGIRHIGPRVGGTIRYYAIDTVLRCNGELVARADGRTSNGSHGQGVVQFDEYTIVGLASLSIGYCN